MQIKGDKLQKVFFRIGEHLEQSCKSAAKLWPPLRAVENLKNYDPSKKNLMIRKYKSN